MIRTELLADLTAERMLLLVRKRVPASSAASTVSATSPSTQRNAPRSRTASPLYLLCINVGHSVGDVPFFAKSGAELLIDIHRSNQFCLGCSSLGLSGSPFFNCGACIRPSNLRTPGPTLVRKSTLRWSVYGSVDLYCRHDGYVFEHRIGI